MFNDILTKPPLLPQYILDDIMMIMESFILEIIDTKMKNKMNDAISDYLTKSKDAGNCILEVTFSGGMKSGIKAIVDFKLYKKKVTFNI